MQSNNESFKLLELSDDLRSLSDLELPEIVNQRKRKVRRYNSNFSIEIVFNLIEHKMYYFYYRKTRLRTPSNRLQESLQSDQSLPCYKNLGLWIAIFMTCGWLFILSYMTTVIHSENNRLKIEVQTCKYRAK